MERILFSETDDDDDESEESGDDGKVKNPVLITELGVDAYDSDSELDWLNRNRRVEEVTNDEDWDTDLEEG